MQPRRYPEDPAASLWPTRPSLRAEKSYATVKISGGPTRLGRKGRSHLCSLDLLRINECKSCSREAYVKRGWKHNCWSFDIPISQPHRKKAETVLRPSRRLAGRCRHTAKGLGLANFHCSQNDFRTSLKITETVNWINREVVQNTMFEYPLSFSCFCFRIDSGTALQRYALHCNPPSSQFSSHPSEERRGDRHAKLVQ